MKNDEIKPLILVVDDNPQNLQFIGNLLADNGYEPAVTMNGSQALEFLENEKPTLILLDVMMPEMDGYEVCKRIKSKSDNQDIPIIFLTAKTETDDIIEGFNSGAVDYVIKPFNPPELLARVKTHIELNLTREELKQNNELLKRNEAEIRQLNEQLKGTVIEKSVKLEHAQEEILEKEHKSELADITTGTLHNVKNILTSVKTSSEFIMENILNAQSGKAFKKANDLLKKNLDNISDFIVNNPKGKMLLEYYLKIEDLLNSEKDFIKSDLERIAEKVEVIEKIVSVQQEYGGGEDKDKVNLGQIIDDALAMQSGSIDAHRIEVIKEYDQIPNVYILKTKFMHILINLIKNAKEAMIETAEEDKKLMFIIEQGSDKVRLKVKDTGIGISKDNLKHIFTHGFTTKSDGHGFGLHSCAAYMKEMNGEISVESEGKGKGATFVIELPMDTPR